MYLRRAFLRLSVLVVYLVALVLAQDNGDMQVASDGIIDNYPTYSEVPRGLQFTCRDKIPGYYADVETQCQVWHWCLPSGQKFSFLCPNGTVFNQAYRVCDWHFKVNCADSLDLYSINNDLYRDREGNLI